MIILKRLLAYSTVAHAGYVLIGMNTIIPELFKGIAWGQDTVLTETTNILQRRQVNWQALDQMQDIDRPEDLPSWLALKQGVRRAPSPSAPDP